MSVVPALPTPATRASAAAACLLGLHRLLPVLACLLLAHCQRGPSHWHYHYQPGKTALLVRGKAVPPAGLPAVVMRAINAGNRIVGKPYRYGGGHQRIEDRGYDCSGTVSYVLYYAGLLHSPATSTGFMRYGHAGAGRHLTVYSEKGHCFIEVAGLRLDTGYHGGREGPQWTTRSRPIRGYVLRHPRGY